MTKDSVGAKDARHANKHLLLYVIHSLLFPILNSSLNLPNTKKNVFFKLKKINKENYRTNVRVTEPQKVSCIEASQKSCQHCNAHLTVKMQPGLSQESLFWRHVPRIDFWVPALMVGQNQCY